MKCNCCHTCGASLLTVLDGEEWCLKCEAYRRYASHGWARGEDSACPAAGTPHTEAKAVVASSMARADAAGLIGRYRKLDDLLAERYEEREALDSGR